MTKDPMSYVIVAALLVAFIAENRLNAQLVASDKRISERLISQCTAPNPLVLDMPEIKRIK